MSDIKKELKELEEIMHSTDEDREQKFEKKFLYIREHYTSEEDNEAIYNFTLNGYKQINNELENMTRYLELQNQIKSVKEIIPVSYIARNYFGKSALGCNNVFTVIKSEVRYIPLTKRTSKP